MPKAGRNDLCPCGSGQKFKRCCESKQRSGGARGRLMLLIVGGSILAALIGAIASFTSHPADTVRIWSQEHGHYHDANGNQVP